jgi:hypothetical protein
MKVKNLLLIGVVLTGLTANAQNYFQTTNSNPGSIEIEHNGSLTLKSLSLKNSFSFYSSESGYTHRRLTFNTQQGNNSFIYNYDPNAASFHTINIGGLHSLSSGLTILGNGNLGIGNENPEHLLHLKAKNPTLRLESEVNNANGSMIRFTENQLQGAYFQYNGDLNRFDIGMHNAQSSLEQDDTPAISILRGNNHVGIGTTNPGNFRLAVEGTIGAREVKVTLDSWSDFVFNCDYKLKDLEEVEIFINKNKRLPDIPSEKDVIENGVNLGEMDAKLLQKIEELTLYVIEMNKRVNTLESENLTLKEELKELKSVE